jgi:hypothetical protein
MDGIFEPGQKTGLSGVPLPLHTADAVRIAAMPLAPLLSLARCSEMPSMAFLSFEFAKQTRAN